MEFTDWREWWRYRLTRRIEQAKTEAGRVQARYALSTFEACLKGRGPKLLFFGQGKPHIVYTSDKEAGCETGSD